MTRKEAMPLVLVIFAIICALPATVVSPPSAIAQDDDEAENLASGTVSNILDNVNTAGDDTNTEVSVPITDQDQTDVNLGLSEALSPQDEPPEFVAFCLQLSSGEVQCYNTSEDCADAEIANEALGRVISSRCEGFETLPSNAGDCEVRRNEQGEPTGTFCEFQD